VTESHRLVLVTKDRLLRSGRERLFRINEIIHVEIVFLDATSVASREQQVTNYLIKRLTVFS